MCRLELFEPRTYANPSFDIPVVLFHYIVQILAASASNPAETP
ncbi:MAG: hypothetical protein ACI9LA_002348, partial [Bacteroidia bacterium]